MIAPFVDVAWLHAHRADVVVADVRWYLDGRSGRAAFDGGHLPGAVFVDLDRWLSAPASDEGGRHPLPEPAVFAEGMAALGIGAHDVVVAYDDQGGVIAGRLVWMLRATGHEAALLDGGLGAFDGALETAEPPRIPATFDPVPWPEDRLADIDAATDPAHLVFDARPRGRYLGAPDPHDPRAGHIPGARSLPVRENLDADGRLLDAAALRERFAAIGVGERDGSELVAYCGSGVSACLNLLAIEHAGLGVGRLFPGSWSQYSRDLSRPVETRDPGA